MESLFDIDGNFIFPIDSSSYLDADVKSPQPLIMGNLTFDFGKSDGCPCTSRLQSTPTELQVSVANGCGTCFLVLQAILRLKPKWDEPRERNPHHKRMEFIMEHPYNLEGYIGVDIHSTEGAYKPSLEWMQEILFFLNKSRIACTEE
jgi:hypothetical protein